MPLTPEAARQALPILMKAIVEFNNPVVERILEVAPELLLQDTPRSDETLNTNVSSLSPIEAAIQVGQIHLIPAAVRCGWTPNNTMTSYYGSQTLPLAFAIGQRNDPLIIALLNHGANPNGVQLGSKHYKEHLASKILRHTLYALTPDTSTPGSNLAPLGLLRLAIAKGARFDMEANAAHGFPGFAAYETSHVTDYAPVALMTASKEWERTPHVMVAATKLLLEAGADFDAKCLNSGLTAFSAAAARKNILGIVTLIKAGAQLPPDFISDCQSAGMAQEDIAQIQAAKMAAIAAAAVAERAAQAPKGEESAPARRRSAIRL